ncbi:MAG: ATP-binding cassette domain-containing protein [Bacteroidales bacterium]|nr:ATP-binding cassette domain-containing protein [Bacteroidales bacterium]
MDKLFEISDLRCSYDRHYREGVSKVVLEIHDLVIPKGKKVFIVGESGIGKSTILEVLGLMNNTIVPQERTKFIFHEGNGSSVDLMDLWAKDDDDELSEFRLRHFNFIFQSTNLMRNFTAYENIALTRMLQGYSQAEAFEKASQVLEDLGLEHITDERMAQELSGGQQQRLAFARAILPDFTVLFGDEPTGNLDSDNAVKAMELLTAKLNGLKGSSAIIVSHDMHLSVTFADMIIKIRKESRPVKNVKDEVTYYGVIDDTCIFTPSHDGKSWSNGVETYETAEFELYLKKI